MLRIERSISTLLLLIFSFYFSTVLFATNPPPKDEDVIIKSSIKKLTFYIDKSKTLKAKLNVKQTAVSKTSLRHTFKRSIFFDNYSVVTNITHLVSRKKKKLTPIITDYESDGIFHSDLKMCYFEHTFNAIDQEYTYEYQKEFNDLKFLESLYFNDAHLIKNSTLIIEVADGVKIDIRELNFDKEQPEYSEIKEKKKTVHTFKMKDVSAAFQYKGTPRRSKFNAHLIIIPNAYTVDGKTKKLIEKVDDLYKWYASLIAQTGNDPGGLNQIVADLTKEQTNDIDKIKSIFYWVQDNIRYIAFEYGIMGFKPENCQSVFKNKYGDCKGMANLTKEMLKIAGYDARLTWLGTADVPYSYDIPSLVVDNHMICTVILDGKKIFLDPTEKYADLYNYAFRIQGQQALIEDGDNFIIERIPALDSDHNKEFSEATFNIKDETIEGSGTVSFQGNRKTYILYILSSLPKNKWEETIKSYIRNADKNIQIDLDSEVNLDNRDENFNLKYQVKMDHHIINLGEEMYLNLEYDYQFKNLEMPKERNVPYEFSGKYHIHNTSTLNIPEGWSVSYLPPTISKDHEQYKFELSFEEKGNQIIYNKKISIKDVYLDVNDFEEWNTTIKELNKFYTDQIIIKKDKN